MIKLIHSFSTKPMSINCYNVDALKRLFGNIWYYALSVAYAKKIGALIVLYTDTLGKALLLHLPYDEIHLIEIDDLIHPRFWAASKFYALKEEPLGSIHIDGDFFIKSKDVLDLIEDTNWDLLVSHFEEARWYVKEKEIFEKNLSYLKHKGKFDFNNLGGCNTGIIGIRDLEIKDEFIDGYLDCAKYYSKISKDILDSGDFYTPDLVLEQGRFYSIAKDKNIFYLLTGDPVETAKKLRVLHVLTSSKFNLLNKTKSTLLKVNPEIYYATDKLCKNII